MSALDKVRPDPGPARDWLRQELRDPEYHRSLFQRFTSWFSHRINDALDSAGNANGLTTLIGLVLLVILVGIALLLFRLRYEKVSAAKDDGHNVVGAVVSAEEHRARARAALAEGRHEEAVVEAVRAISRDLVDRTILPDDPGTTAHELSVAAGAAFPALAPRLAATADLFDGVQYGARPASADDARGVLDLDDALHRARPERRTRETVPQ